MADEQLAIAESGQEAAPAPATTEPTDAPETILEPGEEPLPEAAPAEIEVIEIEWDDGQKYQIPKALESGLLKNKDYTQKTQEVSATKKALEAREAEIEERSKVSEDELRERAVLIGLDEQLASFAKLTQADWDAYAAQDPVGTDQAWRRYQLLKEQRGEVAKSLETKTTERTAKAQQDLATRVQETLAFAQKEIPGWKPELTDTLVKFAIDEGVPEAVLKSNWSPTFYKLLHKAHIGSLTLQKQATLKPLAPAVAPLATVGARTTPAASGDLASMDMEAYVAARKKGVGGSKLR